MLKRLLSLTVAIFFALTAFFSQGIGKSEIRQQLERLDKELEIRDTYITKRQQGIDSIHRRLTANTSHDGSWIKDVMTLANHYNSFNIDSALYYYSAGYNRSLDLKLDSLASAFRMHRATVYPVVGFIKNAIDDYETIDTTGMSRSLKELYYNTGRQMYSYIGSFYINYPDEHDRYTRLATDAQRSLISILPQNSTQYKLNLGEYFYYQREYTKAKVVLEELLSELDESDNTFARGAHILSDIAKARGNLDEYLYYLTLSAISDTKSATLEVNSLQELGQVLFEQGDVERAYSYLLVALDGAVKGHATMRLIQTAEAMPLIEGAHKVELDRQNRRIYITIGIMALLVIVLAITLSFIRREMKHMTILQTKLEGANHIKDIYISQFLSLCSIYMDKLNQFCKIANRKISAGQVDDLYKMTKSGKFIEEQSREFYQVFDNAFLHIYPTFVASVNALLKPNEQITVEDGEILNTDLRILAFMRLGIEDTSKIAQVLNYSVNTIYTYRNKIRNRAINRDNFESEIMKISSIN